MSQPKRARNNPNSMPKRRIKVARSGVHGRGVYATMTIRKGTRIIEYTGERVPWKEAQKREAEDPANPYHTFFFSLHNGNVIDAGSGGNSARWINHSCDPNCETAEENGRMFVYALRTLRAGDELFYDYKLVPAERRTKKLEKEFACRCGSANCRGTMLERR
jgi:SET domain-containing protein